MEITGTAHLQAGRATAWAAFHDPEVLLRTVPGVESLAELGEDRYAVRATIGVASIKGAYEGEVAFREQQPPDAFVLEVQAAGGPGTVSAEVHVRMADAGDGGTDLTWAAAAVVGGPVGGVGQRMLAGAGKRMVASFLAAIDRDLATGGRAPAPSTAGSVTTTSPATSATTGSGGSPAEARGALRAGAGPAARVPAAGGLPLEFGAGVLLGALVALGGVLVGSRTPRR
ncbi:SRPBCC domain-containing protein [Kocuria sp.]|uniref:SRPBCC domain-containing protein n=1 Tax=Kocuria sp. TaxID=1871328 RepID=UPI002811D1AE|nr:SRPBCC domain-containing protein [Kocuria sp.]HST73555.1 SRPBCC domain-containing protein [Kocuria rosea]